MASASAAAATTADDAEAKANDVGNTDVVQKYKVAADIVNDALKVVLAAVAPGKAVVELCKLGDERIQSRAEGVYGKLERGVAFPTCVSVNHCAGHYSPLADDTAVLAEGDVVKVDLGVHVDGYLALAAETVVVRGAGAEAAVVEGRAADVLAAAYVGAEAALRLLCPGNTNTQVTAALAKVAAAYNCRPVEGVLSHQMKRYVIDGPKVILGREDPDNSVHVDEVVFELGEVYCVDVLMSTGEGATKEGEAKATVFRRNVDTSYSLKMKSSRTLLSEASKRFPTLPFPLRALDEDRKARLGIVECLNHDLFTPFPILYEKPGELVAQCKFTILLMPSGPQKITSFQQPAYVKSSLSVTDPDLVALLAQSAAPKKNKKGKKKAKAGTATGSAGTAPADEGDEGDDAE